MVDFNDDVPRNAYSMGFDLDLVGFDCSSELLETWLSGPERRPMFWHCPFAPGCGATKMGECPLMKRMLEILPPPLRMQ